MCCAATCESRLLRVGKKTSAFLSTDGFSIFANMKNEPFRTDYEFLKGVDYIFVSLERNLSGEECHELAEKYFETHTRMTLPGQALRVDLRPAFRKPLVDVTPKFLAVSNGHTFTPQR